MPRFAAVVALAGVAWLGLWLTNHIPLSIDQGPITEPGTAIAIDLGLILLFGLQHSLMARPAWKRRIAHWIPERSAYLLATTLVLAILFMAWRPLPALVWQLPRFIALGQLLGALLATWAVITLDARAFLGLRPQPSGLRTTGPYRYGVHHQWARHPIMLGTLLALWCAPTMTQGHLLFSASMTIYAILGTILESRDLNR